MATIIILTVNNVVHDITCGDRWWYRSGMRSNDCSEWDSAVAVYVRGNCQPRIRMAVDMFSTKYQKLAGWHPR